MRHPLRVKFFVCISILLIILSLTVKCNSLDDMIDEAEKLTESLSIEGMLNMLLSNMGEKLKSLMKSFSVCFAIITASIVFSSLKSSFSTNQALFDNISTCLIILSTAIPLNNCFSVCSEHLEALCGYMIAFIPTSILLYTASGSTFTAALSSSSVPIIISIIQVLSTSIVLPIIKSICSLTIVNTLCKKSNFSGLTAFLKTTCLWIIGLGFTLFTGVLSLQSILQSELDNLTIKGLKYGAARLIPIAGGMISESMRTVITSVSFIKSVTGVSGIVFIIFTIIPNLCTLLATKFLFGILSAFAKGTSQDTTHTFLNALGGIFNILSALIIGVSIAFIIVFAVFMKTGVTI